MDRYRQKKVKRDLRHNRVRARVKGTPERPRLSIFKSNKYIYAQVIDDVNSKTIASASDEGETKGTKIERAVEVGKKVARNAQEAGVKSISFDRGGYRYHGRVKALAEGARAGGLEF